MPKKEIYEPEYTPELNVFGMISPDPAYTFVIVERTLRLNEDSNTTTTLIDDAIVLIIHGADTIQLTYTDDHSERAGQYGEITGKYLDIRGELRILPGETYHLKIIAADGRKLTAATRVPFPPDLSRPAPAETLTISKMSAWKIEWLGAAENIGYALQIWLEPDPAKFENPEENPGRMNIVSDYFTVAHFFEFNALDLEEFQYIMGLTLENATIKILAVDRNYYDYGTKSALAELTGSNLELVQGGTGVFGSVAADSVNVILK